MVAFVRALSANIGRIDGVIREIDEIACSLRSSQIGRHKAATPRLLAYIEYAMHGGPKLTRADLVVVGPSAPSSMTAWRIAAGDSRLVGAHCHSRPRSSRRAGAHRALRRHRDHAVHCLKRSHDNDRGIAIEHALVAAYVAGRMMMSRFPSHLRERGRRGLWPSRVLFTTTAPAMRRSSRDAGPRVARTKTPCRARS